jgi:hypothetical protein
VLTTVREQYFADRATYSLCLNLLPTSLKRIIIDQPLTMFHFFFFFHPLSLSLSLSFDVVHVSFFF